MTNIKITRGNIYSLMKKGVEKFTLIDLSEYIPSRSTDGGCYAFTTEFMKNSDGDWEVYYDTSSGFQYCPYCGTFYNEDICPCCGDEVEVLTSIELINRLNGIYLEEGVLELKF